MAKDISLCIKAYNIVYQMHDTLGVTRILLQILDLSLWVTWVRQLGNHRRDGLFQRGKVGNFDMFDVHTTYNQY